MHTGAGENSTYTVFEKAMAHLIKKIQNE